MFYLPFLFGFSLMSLCDSGEISEAGQLKEKKQSEPTAQGMSPKCGQKECKTRGWGGELGDVHFWKCVADAHNGSQHQASQKSSVDGGGVSKPPPLTEELLTVYGCRGREGHCSLVGCPHPSWTAPHLFTHGQH